MLLVISEALVRPDNRARMERASQAMILASRTEAGCLGYSYGWSLTDPDTLVVVEQWRDAAALRDHFQTPHMADFLKELAEMGNPEPHITVHETDAGHRIGRYARPG